MMVYHDSQGGDSNFNPNRTLNIEIEDVELDFFKNVEGRLAL